MNASLQDVYRQSVLAHSRNPHNERRPADANREVTGFNQLCGDKITVYLTLENETVTDVAFEGCGCAISVASASMMTDALAGLTEAQAVQLVEQVEHMFSDARTPEDSRLSEVQALAGVRDYPSRIKCATLAWQAVAAALRGEDHDCVTTE